MLDFTAIEILEGFSIDQLEIMHTATLLSIESGTIEVEVEAVFESLMDNDAALLPMFLVYLEAILSNLYQQKNLKLYLVDTKIVHKYTLLVDNKYPFVVSSLKEAFTIIEWLETEDVRLFKSEIVYGKFNNSMRYGLAVVHTPVYMNEADKVVNCFTVEDNGFTNIFMTLEAALEVCEFSKKVKNKSLKIHRAKALFSFVEKEVKNVVEIGDEIPTFLD